MADQPLAPQTLAHCATNWRIFLDLRKANDLRDWPGAVHVDELPARRREPARAPSRLLGDKSFNEPRSLISAGRQQRRHSTCQVNSVGPESYFDGALTATGRNSRSWKSKLKSVSGETAAIRTSSTPPSGFSVNVT